MKRAESHAAPEVQRLAGACVVPGNPFDPRQGLQESLTLLQPGRIVFGPGCSNDAVEYVSTRKLKKLFVVTSSPVVPALKPFIDALSGAGCELTIWDQVNTEPSVGVFEQALSGAKRCSADGIIGAGGGSPLDVAKLVAALAESHSQHVHHVFGIDKLESRSLPLICLPTTSGTGSEVSPNAILLDEEDQLKKGVISPHLVPDAAFVDPLLTVSVPPGVTAATGLDAMIHCIEAYANKFSHPIVDSYALEGVRRIGSHLLEAVKNGRNIEARTNLALGSLFGGLCLGPVNTAAVHALAYPLGSQFHIAHGVSNAVLLPHVLSFNLPAAPDRYAAIAEALGAEPCSSELETGEKGIEILAELSRASGLPQRLRDLGVPATAFPAMAQSALTVTRLLKNNPRPVSMDDALGIYEAAF